jgi:hypothetical protein
MSDSWPVTGRAIAVQLERTPGDVALGHSGRIATGVGGSTDGIVGTSGRLRHHASQLTHRRMDVLR